MKGSFNLGMTQYYIKGTTFEELSFIENVLDDKLSKMGYKFSRYEVTPVKPPHIEFRVVYDVPPERWFSLKSLTVSKF